MPKQNGANGEHVVTMREVAKAAGVSIKTVSNVVNDYEFVSQATRDKVNKAIDELGYTLNVSARNLRRGQTGIIGLAIPDLQMPYFAQLSSLVIEEAKKLGLRVIVEPTQYSREGEIEALEEAGVEFDERLVVESGMWHRSDGVRVMNALLDSGVVPDGVVALNDMLASGVMHAIQMHNLRIPEDISVIGFDNSDDSQYLSPALTSIAPGLEAVARLSVKLLKDRIDGVSPSKDLKPEQKVFRKVSSSLVVRQSTKLPTNSLVV